MTTSFITLAFLPFNYLLRPWQIKLGWLFKNPNVLFEILGKLSLRKIMKSIPLRYFNLLCPGL